MIRASDAAESGCPLAADVLWPFLSERKPQASRLPRPKRSTDFSPSRATLAVGEQAILRNELGYPVLKQTDGDFAPSISLRSEADSYETAKDPHTVDLVAAGRDARRLLAWTRSEEHTSELQSRL